MAHHGSPTYYALRITQYARRVAHFLPIPLFYAALALVLTWPLAGHLADALPSAEDSVLHTWTLAWIVHSLTTDPANIWNGNVFYPYPNAVAFGNPLVAQAVLGAPILLATGNAVLTFNLLVLASFILSALTAYALAHHVTRHRLGSLVAGVVFAFSAYRFSHAHQLELTTTQWLPLVFLTLDRLVQRPSHFRGVALAGTLVLAALSTPYYAAMLLPLLGLYLTVRLAIVRPAAEKLPGLAVSLLFGAVVSLVVLIPFALPHLWLERELGLTRSIREIVYWSAHISDYLTPHGDNLLYQPLLQLTGRRGGEHLLFPGLIALALAAIGVFCRPASEQTLTPGPSPAGRERGGEWSKRGEGASRSVPYWPFVAVAVAAFVLSLGPDLRTPAVRLVAPTGTLPLPYTLLYDVLPGFQQIRVAARFGLFVNLAVAVLAANGVARLTLLAERWGGRADLTPRPPLRRRREGAAGGGEVIPTAPNPAGRTARAFGLIVLGLAVAEVVTPAVRMVPIAATAEQAPPVYRWLAAQEADAVVLELPMQNDTPYGRFFPIYEYYSTFHWRPIVNGHLSFYPPGFFDVVDEMERFPGDAGISLLQALGVRYVVVHTAWLPPSAPARWPSAETSWPALEPVAAFDGDVVYRVLPGERSDDVAVRVLPGPNGADGTVAIEVVNRGRGYFVGKPAGHLTATVCRRALDGTAEATVVDGLAPLVVPPGGARPVQVRTAVRSPGTCQAGSIAAINGVPVPILSERD